MDIKPGQVCIRCWDTGQHAPATRRAATGPYAGLPLCQRCEEQTAQKEAAPCEE
jgi:hypothetical protein